MTYLRSGGAESSPSPEKSKTSYYYLRGEQTNGELVWVSPMWITLERAHGRRVGMTGWQGSAKDTIPPV